ncbi:MAG: RagB/SusD family nutrient uptake outer membrane protein [Longimicrobiaceae bacterium]
MKRNHITAWIATAVLLAGCDSPLDTAPTDSIDSGDALTTARGVELAINGAYSGLQTFALYSLELTVYPDLYADNLDFTGTFGTHGEVGNSDISASNGAILGAWEDLYDLVNRANNIIAAVPAVTDFTAGQAVQFEGEALFLRALSYLNAVRYWGGVPLVLEPSTDVTEESNVARSSPPEVYAEIEADLQQAATLLPASGSRGRATVGAANAVLARAYLEQGKWEQARDLATAVIESGEYSLTPDYTDLFEVQNTVGSILEIQYSVNDANGQAFWYFPQSLGGRRGFAPTSELFNAFEAGDVRRDFSIGAEADGNLYGSKYFRISNGDDNVFVIRLAEMYLARAEANARLGAPTTVVQDDINSIRNRAGLAALDPTVVAEEDLITAILQERRVEFAFEGHRFFDLRRTGRAIEVLGFSDRQLLFPVPQAELDVNPNLDQNPGY